MAPRSTTDAPTAYQTALLEAAAARAAQKAITPQQTAVQMAAAAGESVIVARESAAEYAKKLIRQFWATVNPYDQTQVDEFATKATKVMVTARIATARAAAAAVVTQLKTIGVSVKAVPSMPKDVRGSGISVSERGKVTVQRSDTTVRYDNGDTADIRASDMTTEQVFKRPASGFRWVQSEGGADAAQRSGLRIDQIVDDELMLAQRLAETEVMVKAQNLDVKGAKVIGYRRVIHPELSRGGTCGMCIAAADRVYKASELRPIHANCKCTIAPITSQHDPGDELNKADLKQLYADAGGTSAAHLKRTRYKVDEHGELGPVLVPDKPYTPRDAKKRASAANNARAVPGRQESKAEIAARHLPQLEKSLADLRSRGLAEDSSPISWHNDQIARLKADLSGAAQPVSRNATKNADAVREHRQDSGMKPPVEPPVPPRTGGSGGGDDGGDDNPSLSPQERAEARAATQRIIESAAAAEPAISADVVTAVEAHGGAMERYGSRLKSFGSLYRKIQGVMVEDETFADEAALEIRDAVRYTAVLPEKGYWAAGSRIGEALRRAGYDRRKKTIGWNRFGYKGRNDTFVGSDGVEFEVQFHTAASLAAAERTHVIYEEQRLTSTPAERKAELAALQDEIFAAVPAPDDVKWVD